MYRIIVILIFLSTSILATNYSIGDTLYVWARNGVNLRETPSMQGKVIEVLKYGVKIEIVNQDEKKNYNYEYLLPAKKYDYNNNKIKPLSLNGYWIKVKVGEKTGYTFNKLLLEYEPYNAYNFNDNSEYFSVYLQKVFKLEELKMEITEVDKDEKELYDINKYFKQIYSSKYSKNSFKTDYKDYCLIIENISFEEAVVIASVLKKPNDYIDYFKNIEGKEFTYSIEGHPKNRLTIEKVGNGAKISWYYCRWD